MPKKRDTVPRDVADALDLVTAWRDDPEQGAELAFQLIVQLAKLEGPPGLVQMVHGFVRLVEILLSRLEEGTSRSADEILHDVRKHPS